MGHRANYIIIEGEKLSIHYNHWRANNIASDLYLGEAKFLAFVNRCQVTNELIDEPYIEGCVIVDRNKKVVSFWTDELCAHTSVIDYYLKALSKRWPGWQLNHLKKRMYDAENVLGIDYISNQEMPAIQKASLEEVRADKVDDWVSTLVIMKQADSLFITKTGDLTAENIAACGPNVLPLLKDKPQYGLPREGEDGTERCLFIDQNHKKIVVNESVLGLFETGKVLWPDYELIIGDFGYIEVLRLAGIETSALLLSQQEIRKQFQEMVSANVSFDPNKLAQKLAQEHKEIKFNADYFDNVKPRMSFRDIIKAFISNIYNQKQ